MLSRAPLTAAYAGLWTLMRAWRLWFSATLHLRSCNFKGRGVGEHRSLSNVPHYGNKRFYAGGSYHTGDDVFLASLSCSSDSRGVTTTLWSPPSTTSRNSIIHLQQVAPFTSFLVLENWACMQIEKCASAGLSVQHAVVCPPPPPLPVFLPTVLYLVLQRQAQYLVQTSHSPVTFVQGTAERTAAGQKQSIWHPGGVESRGRRACLEAQLRFLRGSLRGHAHPCLYIFNQLFPASVWEQI